MANKFALSLVSSIVTALIVGAAVPASPKADNSKPILIGLDADMSGNSASSGEAIRRGAILAIGEINAAGGVLGRNLSLEIRDHRGIPARGVDNIDEFASMEGLVAVLGGIHTPVALAEIPAIHRHGVIYLGPWAAGTAIVDNGKNPNFVFRVSVRDQFAGDFLIGAAQRRGFRNIGLLLWRSGWGKSNETAMRAAIEKQQLTLAGIEWFNSAQRDMTAQIASLANKGAEAIMLVANPADGLTAVRNMAALPATARRPIISHWGITGGAFHELAPDDVNRIDLTFLQTYSFTAPAFPRRAKKFLDAYCKQFGPCESPAHLPSTVGTAHAYDLFHLLARAIEKAGSADRSRIRQALENLESYKGLIRDYEPAFTPGRHDALNKSDFSLARFGQDGSIVPVVLE